MACACAHANHVFDRGYMSFSDDGSVLLSGRAQPNRLRLLGIDPATNVGPFKPEQREYLAYHARTSCCVSRAVWPPGSLAIMRAQWGDRSSGGSRTISAIVAKRAELFALAGERDQSTENATRRGRRRPAPDVADTPWFAIT